MDAEIDSIRASIDRLGLDGGSVMRLRLGTPSDSEMVEFRRAAELKMRWAIARMRTGVSDDRVKGAVLLEEAREYDPENPLLAVIQASYLDMAGFRSNAVRALEAFDREQGVSDLIDLMRLRKHEREWKVSGEPEPLEKATRVADEIASRGGGWPEAPPWLRFERARLEFLQDSLDVATLDAQRVVAQIAQGAPPDTLTEFQARLLLGAIEVRNLEFARADSIFEGALTLGRQSAQTRELASMLAVPWDLWSFDEQAAYDRSLDRKEDVRRFWLSHDPILATTKVRELQVEYYRRAAEAWFALSGVDLSTPGPWTEPGRAMIRFGRPTLWRRLGARPLQGFAGGVLNYDVNQTWVFDYRMRTDAGLSRGEIVFQDVSGLLHFTTTDSLRGPGWPTYVYNLDFDGRAYHMNETASRFRDWDGRTRLVLSFDTLLPNYSIRYPLQGFYFDGTGSVETAILRKRQDDLWTPTNVLTVDLDSETSLTREREFRRRSGTAGITGVERGVYRIAALLRLRDERGRTVAIAVDNGEAIAIPGYGWRDLEASDLLLTAHTEGMIQDEIERKVRDDLVVFGPDPTKFEVVPRASNRFFQGEDLAFYLEVYNLDLRSEVAVADVTTTLQRLAPDGSVVYSVALTASSANLTKYKVSQWNIGRSLGLGELEPGDYNLVIEIFDRQARQRLEREAGFRIVTPDEMIDLYNWKRLEPPAASLVRP
ncbi:MAG: hypothetical protein R3E12_05200 [Candidatus Eisenbacteria bacterium]|uniref:GWxTD domain-containing protein n=1 Tax=Eiseniibacteriota bacterium TaxID=2212470 RepID=A0A956LXG6_UNCEI|nr:hypothetical protein [Candidatus Eisenbacteria bacterium]